MLVKFPFRGKTHPWGQHYVFFYLKMTVSKSFFYELLTCNEENSTPTGDRVRLAGLIQDYVTSASPNWTGLFLQEGAGQTTKYIDQPGPVCQWQGCHFTRDKSMNRKSYFETIILR